MKKYKVVFFGTPEFSVPFLNALLKDVDFEVVGIVTGEDKKSGRGQRLKQSSVADCLSKLQITNHKSQINSNFQIPIFKTSKILNLKSEILNLHPQVAVLVAYGKIIPKEIIDLFPKGIINVHPSLLPKYRGPDPLRAVILNGDNKTGISIMKLDEKMDHGPIINQTEININKNDDLGDLYEKVIKIGPHFLIKSLKLYLEGKIKAKPQNHQNATYCIMVNKSDAQINWNQSAQKIHRHIRAFNPIPGAYTVLNKKILKILKVNLTNNKIEIIKVKMQGKNCVSWRQFLNGYKEKIPQKIIDKICIL